MSELPADLPIFQNIVRRLDTAVGRVRVRAPIHRPIACELPPKLLAGLRAAAREAIAAYGVHGWLSREGRRQDDAYVWLSLTYNPNLEDPQVTDVHQSTLGTSINPRDEFYYGRVERFRQLKHTYFDTYGFRLLTPAAKIGALGSFLSECRLSLVRSRLSVLRGARPEPCSFTFGWHRDEPVFENLRVNIPLFSHRSCRLQIEHERDVPDPRSKTMSRHYLAPGRAYTFDTHRPHRVYITSPCNIDRVHLVLGFSPWLRYDADTDSWGPNEFYGRVHPLDIVREGLLHPELRA